MSLWRTTMMAQGGVSTTVNEPRDLIFELGLLGANLQEEVWDRDAPISVDHLDGTLVVSYHDIVVLSWRVIGDEFICYPTNCRGTYAATSARRVREITIRLVFEFVRELQVNG